MVGLYIGSRTIAVAQSYMTASGTIATDRLGVSNIPPGTVDDSGVIDVDTVSRAVRDLLAASNVTKAKAVTLAISLNGVVTRLLTLPSMPRDEMWEVLRGEVEDYAVLSGDVAVLDFQVIGAMHTSSLQHVGQRVEVLAVAVPKGLIDSYTAVVKAANLKLSAIETTPLAILRALTNGQLSGRMHEPAMLVMVEESGGAIAVVRDEVIRFIHSIESGSDGLSGVGNTLEELAGEIRSSLSYYQTANSPQEGKIEEITLFIDRADSDHICERLSGHLNMPVVGASHASPLLETAGDHIKDQKMNYGLSAYAAIGAAARATANGNDGSIDLLRSQKLKTAGLRSKVSILFLCLFSMLLLGISANLLLKAKANSIIEQVVSANQPALGSQQTGGGSGTQNLRDISSIEADVARLKAQADMTQALVNSTKHVDWAEILREISAIIPKTMWLTDFSWKEGDDATFEGVALSYDCVFKFRDTLTASPYFDSVRLMSARNSTMRDRSVVQFEIVCGIRRRGEF